MQTHEAKGTLIANLSTTKPQEKVF